MDLYAVIAHPEKKVVLPLCEIPIIQQDGVTKNDCELNYSKRLLKKVQTNLDFADMLENSDLANFHAKNGNIKNWKDQFNEACDPEDISDLEVFVVYPIDKNNDGKISKAADFWTTYFADKGLDSDDFHFETGLDF